MNLWRNLDDFEAIDENVKCMICSCDTGRLFSHKKFKYHRCRECGHVVTIPYPSDWEILGHYAKGFNNGNYSVVRKHKDVYRDAMRDIVDVVKEHLGSERRSIIGARVLDVGCYTGEFLEHMSHEGAEVVGIEFQGEAARIANEKLPGKIIESDVMSNGSVPDEKKFDIVTLLGIVEHVVEPIRLLERVKNAITEDGLLVIQTPDATSVLAKVMGKYWPPYTPVEHIHIFSRKSLCVTLKRLGFKRVVVKRHVKKLTFSYVHWMLQTFGPSLYRWLHPLYRTLPRSVMNKRLPFYIGEVIVLAGL